jgi:amino acid adenylation domain-containing protein
MTLGIRPGQRVAILGDRCKETVIALLAASTAGATYVAIDPHQPPARLQLLLNDAEVHAIVASDTKHLAQSAIGNHCPLLSFDDLLNGKADRALRVQERLRFPKAAPSSVAYMLYTSGSTGVPKGVQIEHRSIRAFFDSHNERVGIHPGDRCLSTGPFHFDVTVLDVLLPLYCGATVFFGPSKPIPSLILKTLMENAVTHLYAVGTLLAVITGDGRRLDGFNLSALRVLQTGAEVCNVRVVNEWLTRYPMLKFLNSYGPTEATVGCISYLKEEPGPLRKSDCPIGKPHRNTTICIVSPEGQVTNEAGVPGELLIAGPQLMRGYWRRPIENERAMVMMQGRLYYRTGDYAFVDEAGQYHFVGRIDDEVKLCGFRIHLNEIRANLLKDARVADAVVGVLSIRAAHVLATGLVLAEGTLPGALRDIADSARTLLPHYMIPAHWAVLSAMPRLASGKADRKTIMSSLQQTLSIIDVPFYIAEDEGFIALETT